MLELTPDNTEDYLRAQARIGGCFVRVTPLSGGVSNLVLRVESREQTFVLKQSRPQLRTKELWISDLERIYRELEVMQALEPLLPAGIVPKVLFADRPNFVFAMSHAPEAAQVWKASLLAGHIDLALGTTVGRVLGLMHQASAERRDVFLPFADYAVFDQLRTDPFYRRVLERRPEVAPVIADLIEQLHDRREALCHGDYSPKNMLVHGAGFMLVDYETAYFGDPAMDLGLCLAHLVLKAVRSEEMRNPMLELATRFWEGFAQKVRFAPRADLERRGLAHLGACMLARVDGTSPIDYLPTEEHKERVRVLARAILLEPVRSWREFLTLMSGHP